MDQSVKEITIQVLDANQRELSDASVLIEYGGIARSAAHDEATGTFRAACSDDGIIIITATHGDFETQSRRIESRRLPLTIKFVLGRPGDAYIWVDGTRVPYRPYPDEVAVVAHEGWSIDAAADPSSAKAMDAEGSHDPSRERSAVRTHVVRIDERIHQLSAAKHSGTSLPLAYVHGLPGVQRARAIFRKHGDDVSVISDTVQVRFWPDVPRHKASALLTSVGLTHISPILGSACSFAARVDPSLGENVNVLLGELMEDPRVEAVSTGIVHPIAVNAVTPNDYLWPILWDRKLIRCPDAWQYLQTNVGGKTFGDPNITIGILDNGVTTTNQGDPTHADLQGLISGGVASTLTAAVGTTYSFITVANVTGFSIGDIVDVGLDLEKRIHDIPNGLVPPFLLKIDALLWDAPVGTAVKLHAEPSPGPGVTAPRTQVAAAAPAGTTTISLNNAGAFNPGDRITIGAAAWRTSFASPEQAVVLGKSGNVLTITPILALDEVGDYQQHPIGAPVDTLRKTVASFDNMTVLGGAALFPGVFDHDVVKGNTLMERNHGLLCATIALGTANNNVGVVGVAPDVSLLALRCEQHTADFINILQWAAGTAPHSSTNRSWKWPVLLTHGVEVLSCSNPIGEGIDIGNQRSPSVNNFINMLTRRGRSGRGLLMFMSSGNENMAQEMTRWSTHDRVFCIGAVGLKYDGANLNELRSKYSNYTNAASHGIEKEGWVTLCAPSDYDGLAHDTHNPPNAHFMIGGVNVGVGNRIGSATSTQLVNGVQVKKRKVMVITQHADLGTLTIAVDNIDSVNKGDWLLLGFANEVARPTTPWAPAPSTATGEWIQVSTVTAPANGVITLETKLRKTYLARRTNKSGPASRIANPGLAHPTKVFTIDTPWADCAEYLTVAAPASVIGIQHYDPATKITTTYGPYLVTALANNGGKIRVTVHVDIDANIVDTDPVIISDNAGARVIRCTDIAVASVAGFHQDHWIQLGDPATSGSEPALVFDVIPGPNTLTIAGPLNEYNPTAGSPVNVSYGSQDYWDRFGGTSAATPVAAGVAALVLSAKPTLTWLEVREILRLSALPIDITCHDVRPALGASGNWVASPQVDGRWLNSEGTPIVSTGGSLVPLSDDPDIDSNPTSTTLVLDNVDAMCAGHAVVLRSADGGNIDRRIITNVNATTRTITIDPPLAHTYVDGTATTGKAETTAAANPGDTTIAVTSSDSFVVGQTIRLSKFLRSDEFRVIRAIPDSTHLVIDPLSRDLGGPEDVEGGHIPWRSPFYGFGRVDAAAAVEKAHTYSHDARDLMIRNHPEDDGVNAVTDFVAHPICSPDVWGRVIAPGAGGVPVANDVAALPQGYKVVSYDQDVSYAHLPPHQSPLTTTPYYLYARIRNRGTAVPGLPALQAWARFYIYRSRANGPFRIPRRWDDARPTTDIPDVVVGADRHYGPSGIFFVDAEQSLFTRAQNGELPGRVGGLLPGEHFIVKTEWPQADLPTAGAPIEHRLRTHIIVEVTPHDGVLAGDSIGSNNNITSREVSFATVEFHKDNGDAIPDAIQVKRSGGDSTLAFKIDLADTIGYFRVSKAKIVGTRTSLSGTAEVVEYAWTGATPAWGSTPNTPGWFTVNAPTVPGGAAAAADNDEIQITFTGSCSASKDHDRIDIKLILMSHEGAVLLEESHGVTVHPVPVSFNDLDVGEPNEPSAYAFADLATTTHTKAFGPIDTNKFQVTSVFTATSGTKAYAVSAGEVMLQRVTEGAGYSTTLVNLILRPFNAPRVGTRAVKYFVYRGIRLLDFLDSATNDLDLHSRADKSEFLAHLYTNQGHRRAAFLATTYGAEHTAEAPPATLKSAALGWNSTITAATALEPSFFGDPNAPQLPIASAGMQLGEFASGGDCGFEIVLETIGTGVTYEFARLPAKQVDVSADAAGSFAQRYHREEILHYIDPAAYYGSLYDIGVFARNGTGRVLKKQASLYTDILDKFLSRNRIYIDIRNEADMSMDYYGNYPINGKQLMYGVKSGKLTAQAYQSSQWPIHILERVVADRSSDKLYLAFSMNDNANPALYVEQGTSVTALDGGAFATGGKLFANGAQWTKEIGFKVNQTTVASVKQDVAAILMLKYARRVDPAKVWPAASPVVRFEQYTDNVFGPLNGLQTYAAPPNQSTRWMRLNDIVLVDGRDTDPPLSFGSVVERGIAYQPGQVLFFCSSVRYFKSNATGTGIVVGTGLEGGFSPQPNLFAASVLFSRFEVKTVQLHHNTGGGGAFVNVNACQLVPIVPDAVGESIMLLGLTNAEYDVLIGLLGQLSDKHPKSIVLREDIVAPAQHLNDGVTNYHRYFVELRGLDDTAATSKNVVPVTPIVVYSVDGLTFISGGFDSTKLVPDEYQPSHEETRSLGKPEPEDRIKPDATMSDKIMLFGNALSQILEGATSPQTDIANAAGDYAIDIFDQARTYTVTSGPGDTHVDDRPLYWTRLRMGIALKGHWFVRKNAAAGATLVRDFEWASRGMGADLFKDITGKKKILLCGTDPVGLDADITASNPAGVVALDLHGEDVSSGSITGTIRSVILPLRFFDYDRGLVDEFFKQYLYDHPADLVLVLSQNGTAGYFDIDRFAGRNRRSLRDNNDVPGLIPIGGGVGWKEFYEHNLPVAAMMAGRTAEVPQIVYYDQSYKQTTAGTTTGPDHPRISSVNLDHDDPAYTLTGITGTAESGSAGSFLPNEIFYRLLHLQATPPTVGDSTSTKIGHLAVPTPTSAGMTMTSIVEEVRKVLRQGLSGL